MKHPLEDPRDFAGAVPIIGGQRAPFRAAGAMLMVTVTCQCRPDNPPMLIRGHDLVVQCGFCQMQFAIVNASYDRERGDVAPRMDVAVVQTR